MFGYGGLGTLGGDTLSGNVTDAGPDGSAFPGTSPSFDEQTNQAGATQVTDPSLIAAITGALPTIPAAPSAPSVSMPRAAPPGTAGGSGLMGLLPWLVGGAAVLGVGYLVLKKPTGSGYRANKRPPCLECGRPGDHAGLGHAYVRDDYGVPFEFSASRRRKKLTPAQKAYLKSPRSGYKANSRGIKHVTSGLRIYKMGTKIPEVVLGLSKKHWHKWRVAPVGGGKERELTHWFIKRNFYIK